MHPTTRHVAMDELELGFAREASLFDSEEDLSSSEPSDTEGQSTSVCYSRAAFMFVAVGAICGCAAVVFLADGSRGVGTTDATASTHALIGAAQTNTVATMPAQSVMFAASTSLIPEAATVLPLTSETPPASPISITAHLVSTTPTTTASVSASSSLISAVPNIRHKPTYTIRPQESLYDGNVCEDTEELYAGLCYRKCSILTGGSHPHRSTAFSCCATDDCGTNIFNLETASLVPCEGFDVSSADNSTACPHFPGTCLTDEDMFMGQCYEQCSILTNGQFPNRVAAATCCNTEGADCLDPFNDKTDAAFLVGGGKGDHDAETPHGPHGPLQSLTETR